MEENEQGLDPEPLLKTVREAASVQGNQEPSGNMGRC